MKKLLVIFSFLLFHQNGSAQINHDLELWAGTSLQYKLNKKLDFYIEPEARFNNNMSEIKSVFSDFALKVDLGKLWSIKGAVRYSLRPGNTDKFRTNVDFLLKLKKKKGKLSFRNRIRGQYGFELGDGNFEAFIRDQIKFEYNLSKRVDPYAGAEIFFKFRNNEFRQFRLFGGLDWRIKKWWHISSFYIYQREIYNANPSAEHIIGLRSKFDLEKPKKKSSSSL